MKPTLFIGSSVEGFPIAYAAQQNLHHAAEVTVWDQGVFQLSQSSLESLLAVLDRADFGLFVFSPDDITLIRGEANQTVRDNVLFELGLFVGRLGQNRSFILLPDDAKDFHLPTDLIGMTPATYEIGRSDGNMQSATAPACHATRDAIKLRGRRAERPITHIVGPSPREHAEVEAVADPTATTVAAAKAAAPSKFEWLHEYLKKHFERAIELLTKQIDGLPEGIEKLDLESWRGRTRFRLDPIEGTRTLENLISTHPTGTQPYIHLAFSQVSIGLFNEALTTFDRGIKNATAKEELILGKARTLRDVGKFTDAIQTLNEAISYDPRHAPFHLELATIYKNSDQREQALHVLDTALTMCPDDRSLLGLYAEILLAGPDKKMTLVPYNRLIALEPENTTYLTLRGNLYLELELFDSAMCDYKRANELAKEKQAWILGNIGNLYKNRGFYSDGIDYLKKALALVPDDDYAHQRLGTSLELRNKEAERVGALAEEAFKAIAARRMELTEKGGGATQATEPG